MPTWSAHDFPGDVAVLVQVMLRLLVNELSRNFCKDPIGHCKVDLEVMHSPSLIQLLPVLVKGNEASGQLLPGNCGLLTAGLNLPFAVTTHGHLKLVT